MRIEKYGMRFLVNNNLRVPPFFLSVSREL
jgi:hypothetical protein